MRKYFFVTLTLFFTISFFVFSDTSSLNSALTDKTLNRSLQSSPDTLDPHTSIGIHSLAILRDVFEGLVNIGPDLSAIPGVAEKWDISDDQKIYTFYLNPQAKWSNGQPVTAHDFEFSWKRSVDPMTASPKSTLYNIIHHAEDIIEGKKKSSQLGVKALSDHIFQVQLIAPYPYFLNLISHNVFFPLPKKLVQDHPRDFTRAHLLITNGAFSIKDWSPQSNILLVKNKHYWDAKNVKLDYVNFIPVEDQNNLMKLYRTNKIDFTYIIPDAQFNFIKDNFPDEFKVNPHLCIYGFGFNILRAPFKDNKDLRQALSMAIDRDQIVRHITKSGETPAYSWMHPSLKDKVDIISLKYNQLTQKERIQKAKEILKRQNISPKNPIEIELRFDINENHKKIAIAIASMWKKLGVHTKLVNEELKVFLQNRRLKTVTQAFRNVWTHDYYDPFNFLVMFSGESSFNTTGYNSKKFNSLYNQAQLEFDKQKRNDLLYQATEIAQDDHALMPVYNSVIKRLVKPWVKHYQGNPLDAIYSKYLDIDMALYKKSLSSAS